MLLSDAEAGICLTSAGEAPTPTPRNPSGAGNLYPPVSVRPPRPSDNDHNWAYTQSRTDENVGGRVPRPPCGRGTRSRLPRVGRSTVGSRAECVTAPARCWSGATATHACRRRASSRPTDFRARTMDDNRNGFPPIEGDRLIALATGVLMAWLGMNAPRAERCLRRIAGLMETRPVDLALYLVDLAEAEAAAVSWTGGDDLEM